MYALRLTTADQERHDFDSFSVLCWRTEDRKIDYYLVSGCIVGWYGFHKTLVLLPAFTHNHEEIYHRALDICDMLDFMHDLRCHDVPDKELLQQTAEQFPDLLGYLNDFEFESPTEGGCY